MNLPPELLGFLGYPPQHGYLGEGLKGEEILFSIAVVERFYAICNHRAATFYGLLVF